MESKEDSNYKNLYTNLVLPEIKEKLYNYWDKIINILYGKDIDYNNRIFILNRLIETEFFDYKNPDYYGILKDEELKKFIKYAYTASRVDLSQEYVDDAYINMAKIIKKNNAKLNTYLIYWLSNIYDRSLSIVKSLDDFKEYFNNVKNPLKTK